MPTHPEDYERAVLIASGDPGAVEAFEREFRPKINNLARMSGIPADDCEDVTQNTLLDTHRQLQLGHFRGDSALETWVVTIAHGKIKDHHRARARNRMTLIPIESGVVDGTMDGFVIEAGTLLAPTIDSDIVIAVHEVLERMSDEFRVILILKHAEGLTIEQISQKLSLSLSKTYSTLLKAERRFREMILGH